MKIYAYLFITVLLLGTGVFLGYKVFSPTATSTSQVNATSIVTMLKQEGFLVTQTYILNQQVSINKDSGSAFKDFFWGQDITASGNMKVGSGVDLNKILANDITVSDRLITLKLPTVETHSIELIGEITLANKQGILKRIFDNNNGFNEAYQALQGVAGTAAMTTTLRVEAENSTKKEITKLLGLVAKDRVVEITFKQ